MRFIVLFSLLAISVLLPLPSFAEWDNDTMIEFSKAKEYRYIFSMDGTDYCGMDSVDFVEYSAAKNNTTPEDYSFFLKYIGYELKKSLKEETNKQFSESSSSKYMIYIHLDEITAKAGMKISVTTYVDTPENGQTFRFKVNDGRWNKFGVLLQENAKTLAEKIASNAVFKRIRKSVLTRSHRDSDHDPLYD
ncbi:MAG: hypothetical protein K2I69_03925 [Muribaculaceae bacterium]|nr:hypothetical protein [Muribaculaceae bacterium]